MELFLLILSAVMLLMFGYAQWQKGIFRTPGKITTTDEDEFDVR